MKKILLLLAICTLAACNNVNKEELKKEIINELKSSNTQPSVKKVMVVTFMLNHCS